MCKFKKKLMGEIFLGSPQAMDTAKAAHADLANLIRVQGKLGLGLVSGLEGLSVDVTIGLHFDPVYAVVFFHGMGHFTHLHQ